MVNDPIADFINQLKNAGAVRKECVAVPYSNFTYAVALKLKDSGYVKEVTKKGKKIRKTIEVEMLYDNGTSKIKGVERVSKPGRRLYESTRTIKPVKYGEGALILSTPKGVLTDTEARKERVGGEALFKIW